MVFPAAGIPVKRPNSTLFHYTTYREHSQLFLKILVEIVKKEEAKAASSHLRSGMEFSAGCNAGQQQYRKDNGGKNTGF